MNEMILFSSLEGGHIFQINMQGALLNMNFI